MTELHDTAPEPAADAELFVDFVNTLAYNDGVADERLPDGAALREWLTAHGLGGSRRPLNELDRQLPAFHALRGLLAETTERVASGAPPSSAQLQALNRVMREGLHYHQLEPADGGGRFTVTQIGDELAQARAAIAGSLAHFLAEHDADRIRLCADEGCRWRFIDRSPAGRRRWCDMRICGNRAKVARHRAKARAASA